MSNNPVPASNKETPPNGGVSLFGKNNKVGGICIDFVWCNIFCYIMTKTSSNLRFFMLY